MKTTGITRRIDELGRIVVPKELRKTMHIKKGELLEIFLFDKETIALKKYSPINKNQAFIKEYITFLSSKLGCNIYVTSLDEVIFSNKEETENLKITKKLEGLMHLAESKINAVDNNYYSVFSISPNADIVGYIIFEFFKNLNVNEDIIKFSVSFIENYLEAN